MVRILQRNTGTSKQKKKIQWSQDPKTDTKLRRPPLEKELRSEREASEKLAVQTKSFEALNKRENQDTAIWETGAEPTGQGPAQ